MNLEKGWKLIRQGLDLDDPTPLGKCLGCTHKESSCKLENGKVVRVMEYDMTEFMGSCVDAYRAACRQPDLTLRKVDTPFIPAVDGSGNAPAELVEGGKAGVLAPSLERYP